MKLEFLRHPFVAALFLLTLVLGVGPGSVKADGVPVTMDINVIGVGRGLGGIGGSSETMTGTFQFNSTTGIVSNFCLQGSGLISEYWAFGPVAGTLFPSRGPGYYIFDLSSDIGSRGDVFGLEMILNASGGFVPTTGVVAGGNFNLIDDWSGEIVLAPEPPACLYALGACMVVLIVKWKAILYRCA